MKHSAWFAIPAFMMSISCSYEVAEPESSCQEVPAVTLEGIASIFSQLPIGMEQIDEVHDAVLASAANGYDEEYMLKNLINSPGSGVGDPVTKSSFKYDTPLRDLLAGYLSAHCSTKSGGVDAMLKAMSDSGIQVYWPYSEDWDGHTYPIISFDPLYGAESNIGFQTAPDSCGYRVVDTVRVDETVARTNPVWIINTNSDAAFTPSDFFIRDDCSVAATLGDDKIDESVAAASPPVPESVSAVQRHLILKSFKMLRHYDTIFQGASEFFLKIGSADGFTASTEAELKLYTTSVTDMMIVVRRKYLEVEKEFNAILMTDFTNQIDKVAFLVTEDDGGTQTTWEAEATVKWNSRSYGFTVKIPYNEKDDIVWRGRLAASFFQAADEVSGRFGDVEIKFALE